MFDWDVVIIGGGPAGLTAGLYLARANYRTVIIEKDSLGGVPRNVDMIENYPGFPDGVSGALLVSAMAAQAAKYGVKSEIGEATRIVCFPDCRLVGCSDVLGYTTAVVILAGGSKPRKLGVPGEETLWGKGVFDCALCEGSQYAGKTVVVCGGGEAAISEALYMAKISSKVIVVHRRNELRAGGVLQARAMKEPKIQFIWDSVVEAINGKEKVDSITIRNIKNNIVNTIQTGGVLVQIGHDPNTGFLNGVVPLDEQGQIITGKNMETEAPYILAAGDIRSGSPRQIAAAVGDGVTAAITAQKLLQRI